MPQAPVAPKKALDRSKPIIQIKTMSALGPMLPIGSTGRDIAVRPWRMKEERELGEIRAKHPEANMATYVSNVLAAMCTKLGSPAWDNSTKEQRVVMVSQMWMGDVFYAYAWLRLQAMGNEITFQITCPACRSKFPFTADLNSLDVATSASAEDSLWTYMLRDPFVVRGDKKVGGFVFGPTRWSAIETLRAGKLSGAEAKLAIIRGSVHDVIGDGLSGFALTDNEMDEMSKFDLEKITRLVDDNAIGPDMSVEDNCHNCGSKFKSSIDWNVDSFFGVSSP